MSLKQAIGSETRSRLIRAMVVISVGRITPPREHILVVVRGVAIIASKKDIVHLAVGE